MVWNKGLKGVQPSTKKGKTFEEFYGEERAKEIKNEHRETILRKIKTGELIIKTSQLHTKEAKKKCYTSERNDKISEALTGKKHSAISKEKLSETRKKLFKQGKIETWNKNKKGLQKAWNKNKKCDWVVKRNLEDNPSKRPEVKKKIREHHKKYYKQYPEKHPNRILAKQNKLSKPQKKLFLLIKKIFPDAKLNYPVRTIESVRFADIGSPSSFIDFEYNGYYKHFTPDGIKEDVKRTKEISNSGWGVIVFEPEDLGLEKN